MTISTEQEVFWQGDFGNNYTDRNKNLSSIAANSAFFGKVLCHTRGIQTILELGSNIGLNLIALRQLLPDVKFSALEINEKAAKELKSNHPDVDLHLTSILEFKPSRTWDLVFTKTVLIHINPDKLSEAYKLIYQSSSHYVLVAEYFNPKPIEVIYRGHSGKLFKRDFAGELMNAFPDLLLLDYGFLYHRDPNFPQDDINWFLMEKK